jgi:hypothetical protein
MARAFRQGGTVPGGRPGAADYRAWARGMGLPFLEAIPDHIALVTPAAPLEGVVVRAALSPDPDRLAFFAPDRRMARQLRGLVTRFPREADRIRITTPEAIAAALLRRSGGGGPHLDPVFSARRVATGRQMIAILLILLAGGICTWLTPAAAAWAAEIGGAVFFFGVTMLRFVAAGHAARQPARPVIWRDGDLPVYSVLVPLYREAGLVPELVEAMAGLDWPADLLDVIFVVEADDRATQKALTAEARWTGHRVIVAPPGNPRTKPRALTHALRFAHGSYVTVYDAEDRPHPQQLREAYAAFRAGGPELACVQAPLLISRDQKHLIGRLFALEYSALFDGLIPALAALRLPVPLGGTSNHLRGLR